MINNVYRLWITFGNPIFFYHICTVLRAFSMYFLLHTARTDVEMNK